MTTQTAAEKRAARAAAIAEKEPGKKVTAPLAAKSSGDDDKGEEPPKVKTAGESFNQVAGIETNVDEVLDRPEYSGKTIPMIFPRPIRLTLNDYTFIHFETGINDVPTELAGHWYLKAHAVQAHVSKQRLKKTAEEE